MNIINAYKVNTIRSVVLAAALIPVMATAQESLVKSQPVNFSQVTITDKFWGPKLNLVEDSTLKACIYQTEVATPRIRNFEKVARHAGEKHEGIFYDDSDVFKALEAMAYALKNRRNPELEKKADEWIDKIAAAQLPDGYLNTYYTLTDLNLRWTDMSMHEDYNGGHMIEAAVAYFDATGKRKFLDVAIRWANHFDSLFGPGKRHWVTGHQELELALVKLYRVTNDEKYLKLSHWLLEERGHGYAKGYTWTDWKDTAYAQDVKPVKEQTEITGHAVRAMYMYTGAADVAAHTGDQAYMNAMKAVWEDVVYRNMYITGGIGSSGGNEGFSIDYDLPNERAYCETCASVGMVFWNQRMNSLTGESKYYDVLERSLYNGALDGLSLTGTRFFYGNPLASAGQHKRREWFGTACCPANIARLVASLGNYIYAKSDNDIWVNLFVGSKTNIPLSKTTVQLEQVTNYPWDGKVEIAVNPSKRSKYALHVRIPEWAGNNTATGELYHFLEPVKGAVQILVNGKPVEYKTDKGYAVIDREWKKGDRVSIDFPMEVRKLVSRPEVKEDQGRLALQRGPLVYCIEGADNEGKALNIVMTPDTRLTTVESMVLNEPVIALKGEVIAANIAPDKMSILTQKRTVTAIPYYAWCNRGSNQMQVWIPSSFPDLKF